MRILFSLLIITSLFACDCSKKTCSKKSGDRVTVLADSIYRFGVSFYSKGRGVDKTARQQFSTFLADFQLKNDVTLVVNTSQWGREGEIDYCFKLSELNADKQKAFIAETKEKLKSSTLVHYQENATCRKNRAK